MNYPNTFEALSSYLRNITDEDELQAAVSTLLSSTPDLPPEEVIEIYISILDVLYDDLSGKRLEAYFTTKRSVAVADAALAIPVELLEKRLAETGLVLADGEGNPTGTLINRRKQMVK